MSSLIYSQGTEREARPIRVMCLAALAAGLPDTRVQEGVERYLLRNLPVIAILATCMGLVKRTGLPMLRQGMAETRKRVCTGVVLARRCKRAPRLFFFLSSH